MQLYLFFKCLTKWLPSAILDVRNSPPIAFLAILDQYGIFIFLDFFYKMAASAHFGYPKFTFDRISGHNQLYFFGFFLQNGCRRPFWMSEIHFRSHF